MARQPNEPNTSAGQFPAGGLPNLFNVSFATAGSSASTAGILNLADSAGGTRSSVIVAGLANSALNIGSDNTLISAGVVNNTTNLFGDDNFVVSSNTPGMGLAALVPGLNVGFNILGNNNTVQSGAGLAGTGLFPGFPPTGGNGPGAIAGAIGVNNQNFANGTDVLNNNFGIELRTPFNEQTPVTTLTNSQVSGGQQKTGTQGGVVKQLLSFRPGGNAGTKAASLGGSGSSFKAVSDQINTSLKKLSDAVNKVTNNAHRRARRGHQQVTTSGVA